MNKKILYSGELEIDFSQFYIDFDYDEDADDMVPPDAFTGQLNGLCGAAFESRFFFTAGIKEGIINIEVALYESEPRADVDFEEIVETSNKITKDIMLCQWAHEVTHDLSIPKGDYRVRYCVTGMDIEQTEDHDWDKPFDSQKYLIQFWPSPLSGDNIVKTTSEKAKYWHDSNVNNKD